MRKISIFGGLLFALVLGMFSFQNAFAATPTLQITQDYSSTIRVNINNGMPYSRVDLFMRNQGSSLWTTFTNIGNTDYTGNLNSSLVIGTTSTQNEFYAVVGSDTTAVVSPGGASQGSLSLSQNNVTLNSGQSMTVSAYNTYSGLYVSSNSNSSVATVTLNGSQITVYGNNSGSTTIRLCTSSSYYYQNTACADLYVTVSGGTYGQLTLSQSSVNVNNGQSTTVYAYNLPSGQNLYIANSPNSSVATVSVNGSQINIYGVGTGSTTARFCSSYYQNSGCADLYITVSGGTYSQLTLSQSSLTLNINENRSIWASNIGNNPNLYIASNSNSNVANATIRNNNEVYVTAQNYGTTTIRICSGQYNQGCADLYVTVNYGYNYGDISFLTSTLPQAYAGTFYSAYLQISGGTYPYTFSVTSGSLPQGLTLSSNGQITGAPNYVGNSSFTVQVRDAQNRYGNQTFNMNVLSSGSGNVLGTAVYPNGTLIREGQTIYLVYRNTKSGFSNYPAFVGLGYNLVNVIDNSTYIPLSNFIISSASAAHPWGSWVKSGNTIYFVHQDGLIPIATYDVFLNNGGQDKYVVNANYYDLQRPMLSIMSLNDYRLK